MTQLVAAGCWLYRPQSFGLSRPHTDYDAKIYEKLHIFALRLRNLHFLVELAWFGVSKAIWGAHWAVFGHKKRKPRSLTASVLHFLVGNAATSRGSA